MILILNMIKSERIEGLKEVVSLGLSIYDIPHEERDEILKRISLTIDGDMKINRSREVESIQLAENFIVRPRL